MWHFFSSAENDRAWGILIIYLYAQVSNLKDCVFFFIFILEEGKNMIFVINHGIYAMICICVPSPEN